LQPFESASVAWLRQRLVFFVAHLFHPVHDLTDELFLNGLNEVVAADSVTIRANIWDAKRTSMC